MSEDMLVTSSKYLVRGILEPVDDGVPRDAPRVKVTQIILWKHAYPSFQVNDAIFVEPLNLYPFSETLLGQLKSDFLLFKDDEDEDVDAPDETDSTPAFGGFKDGRHVDVKTEDVFRAEFKELVDAGMGVQTLHLLMTAAKDYLDILNEFYADEAAEEGKKL